MQNKLDHRYIARLIVEAQTPLFVGSGNASLMKDALVQKDHNGLPIIPGTALAGVLRHSLEENNHEENNWNQIFGYQNGNEGLGSRLKISSAYFLLGNNKIAEGFNCELETELKDRFDNLPTRQHVRISDKGVAVKNGLFDNEVVYKGAKFIFEIELDGTKDDSAIWKQIIEEFQSPLFRIGQGTRNGYGNLKVIGIYNQTFNLTKEDDFNEYLNFDSSLNAQLIYGKENPSSTNALSYSLSLVPDDFFIFSEGFGDTEVDNKPLTEEVIVYEDGKIKFLEKTVIPASSIKGAIAHRVCYHYNKIKENYSDLISDNFEKYIGEENPAVAKLFGKKGEVNPETKKNTGQRGILILDDLYYDDKDIVNDKIFNHVAIDRFTGGAMDGALFSEKVSYKKDKKIEFEIYLTQNEIDDDIIKALEETLKDICKGLLPLGGMTTKGNGMFTGELKKNSEEIFDYKKNRELCQTS